MRFGLKRLFAITLVAGVIFAFGPPIWTSCMELIFYERIICPKLEPCEGTLTLNGGRLADVEIQAANSQVGCVGRTDEFGRFQMTTGQGVLAYPGVPPGDYQLFIRSVADITKDGKTVAERRIDAIGDAQQGVLLLHVPEGGIIDLKLELFSTREGNLKGRSSSPKESKHGEWARF